MIKYILALDIGGTNQRLAMLKINKENEYIIVLKKEVDRNQSSIIPEINTFLKKSGEKGFRTNVCCASVAGPVDTQNNACYKPTNAKFPIVVKEIVSGTCLEHILVINDFKAIGEAIATIDLSKKNEDIVQIPSFKGDDFSGAPNFKAKPDLHGNRGVIGPGTGLGIAYLVNTPHGYHVSSSEGGHAGFPTRGDYSLLHNFIRKKLNTEHVGMEALVSGQGIRHIIDFFITHPRAFLDIVDSNPFFKEDIKRFEQGKGKQITDDDIKQAILDEQKNPLKVDVAQLVATSIEKNPKARIIMRLFMEFLGSAAQTVALHGLTTGGLFIAGGIPAKNQDLLKNGDFMRSFCDNWKPNIKELMKKMPVYLITNYDISFIGCARAAHIAFKKYIESNEKIQH